MVKNYMFNLFIFNIFFIACRNGSINDVKELLANGANVNKETDLRITSLILCQYI